MEDKEWLQKQSEYIQILAGEAFVTLMKDKSFKMLTKYLDLLKILSLEMLKLWSADILEIWVDVYALVVS